MPLHLHAATIPSTTTAAPITRRGVIISTATLNLLVSAASSAAEEPPESDTLSNIPQTLSGECPGPNDCKTPRIQRPKSKKAESCTTNCLAACTRRGGDNDRLPLNTRGPLVVFKQGFRSRHYCLVECSDICNLLGDQDYGS